MYDRKEASLDIAIVELEEKHCEHMKQKGKEAINLDSWEKPDFENIRTCVVSGFPTESKKETPNYLSAPLPLIIAEAQSGIIESRNSFVLASKVSENNFFFSGVSGGPVFYIMQDDSEESYSLGVIGIVYEGSPGSSSMWENRGKESFYTRNDILFNVYILTPEIFSGWLKRLDYI